RRLARGGSPRGRAETGTAVDEASVRLARRDAGAKRAGLEPQAARGMCVGAEVSEHARRLAGGRGRDAAGLSCAASRAPTGRPPVYRAWKNLNEVRENPSRWWNPA